MTKFDRESFNLLKMTDSGSESVPDITFDLPNDNRQKKKVRLKRKERNRGVVVVVLLKFQTFMKLGVASQCLRYRHPPAY